jgi:hypothetical protein
MEADLARNQYSFEKRRREIAKKKKKEEKRQRKLEKKNAAAGEGAETLGSEGEMLPPETESETVRSAVEGEVPPPAAQ